MSVSGSITDVGTICHLCLDRGFGFVRQTGGGPDLFFHCSGLAPDLEFGESLLELRVVFQISQGRGGERAVDIRPAS